MIDLHHFTQVVKAAQSNEPVRGLSHGFYRYPARFSPQFARAAIECLTEHGDTVLDPFMGGGTSIIEALALGRKAIGVDINPLATFITRVKTTPLSVHDIRIIRAWTDKLIPRINLHDQVEPDTFWRNYQKHLPWWLRKTIELIQYTLADLESERQRSFIRCTILKTAQWALDCRNEIPSTAQFLSSLTSNIENMIAGIVSYRRLHQANADVFPSQIWRNRRLLNSCVSALPSSRRIPASWDPPKLIITSPPYPGVHVLYHRWQINGRKETPAPYWIANCPDGNGASYYTFGDRKQRNLEGYFDSMRECYKALSAVAGKNTWLVQLVAFSCPEWQLPLFLEILQECGFSEVLLNGHPSVSEGRSWRTVPNRKFYADRKGHTPSSKEVLLVHRRA